MWVFSFIPGHSPRMQVNNGFMDINKILNKYPDIEINNYEDPRWGNAATYFWNEPIWGYYRTSDEWVLRRQAELLADAQIDVVFLIARTDRRPSWMTP